MASFVLFYSKRRTCVGTSTSGWFFAFCNYLAEIGNHKSIHNCFCPVKYSIKIQNYVFVCLCVFFKVKYKSHRNIQVIPISETIKKNLCQLCLENHEKWMWLWQTLFKVGNLNEKTPKTMQHTLHYSVIGVIQGFPTNAKAWLVSVVLVLLVDFRNFLSPSPIDWNRLFGYQYNWSEKYG